MLEQFSRRQLDRRVSAETLRFVLEYGGGIFRPNECGVYEPYELFDRSAIERYVGWLAEPGGEFGFRRSTGPFAEEGRISNLLFSEILVRGEDASEAKPFPAARSPVFCTRWRIRMGREVGTLRGPEFLMELLSEACRVGDADYGFVAMEEDHRRKHFISVREGDSVIEQYVGDDPEHGVPGLYWMNFFGPMYADYFGREKFGVLAGHAEVVSLPGGALIVRFGRGPEESEGSGALEGQRAAMGILGETAFFDIRRPERALDVPPVLKRDS